MSFLSFSGFESYKRCRKQRFRDQFSGARSFLFPNPCESYNSSCHLDGKFAQHSVVLIRVIVSVSQSRLVSGIRTLQAITNRWWQWVQNDTKEIFNVSPPGICLSFSRDRKKVFAQRHKSLCLVSSLRGPGTMWDKRATRSINIAPHAARKDDTSVNIYDGSEGEVVRSWKASHGLGGRVNKTLLLITPIRVDEASMNYNGRRNWIQYICPFFSLSTFGHSKKEPSEDEVLPTQRNFLRREAVFLAVDV